MKEKKQKGFAVMDSERVREISSMGGTAAHLKNANGIVPAHEFTKDEARAAGEKGGAATWKKFGSEHYQKLGRLGAEKRNANRKARELQSLKGGK